MKIGELFMALGFRVDDDNLKQFNNQIKALKKKLFSLPVIIGAAAFAIDKFTASSVKGAVAIQNFTAQTGLLGSELQRYQVAGQLTDIAVSADQITSSVQNLQSNLASIRLGGGNVQPFQLAGVDVIGKDAFQVIDELRDRFQAGALGDRATATNLLTQMGLGSEFVRLIAISRKEFDALGNDFIRSPKLIKGLEVMGTAITKFKMALSFLKDEFNGFVSDAVTGFFRVLTDITTIFTHLVQGASMLTSELGFLGEALKQVAIFGVGLLAIFNPIKTAIVGIILILEDIAVFAQGGKSITGKMVNGFKEMGREIGDFFKRILDWIMELINKPIDKLEDFAKRIKSFFTFGAFDDDKLTSGLASGKATTNNNVIQTTINVMAETAGDMVDAISSAGRNVSDTIAMTYDEITAGDAN